MYSSRPIRWQRQRWPAAVLVIALVAPGCGDNLTVPDPLAGYQAPEPLPLTCLPNLDGVLDAAELPTRFYVPANFRVSPAGQTRPVDTAGQTTYDGHLVWDWSAADDSDQHFAMVATPLAGLWFSASFPSAQFVGPLDAGSLSLGVYSRDAAGLYLHGYASADEAPAWGATLVVYNTPVMLLRFPLERGATWVSVGEIQDGLVYGLPYAGNDTYTISVPAVGRLALPDLTFTQAFQVRMQTVVQPAVGLPLSTRTVMFYFECFGEVARATSQFYEPEEAFSIAAQVRRFGLL